MPYKDKNQYNERRRAKRAAAKLGLDLSELTKEQCLDTLYLLQARQRLVRMLAGPPRRPTELRRRSAPPITDAHDEPFNN